MTAHMDITRDGARVVWRPQARQAQFMARPEYEVLYGGAAGGGKSDALLCEGLRQVHLPNYRGIIFRKTYPQLSELIDRSRALYGAAYPRARYISNEHVWRFPSGAMIYFGNMTTTADRINYQGKRYDYIAFDELTHFTWDEYSYMMSRNRPSGGGTRVYMRAATNPGGIGHSWVRDRFVTAAAPFSRIVERVSVRRPDGSLMDMERDRAFVPSTVFDNEELLRADPDYLAKLSMLPQAERDALLYGSWDSFSGQVFTQWRNDEAHYDDRRWTHVINPFTVPKHWRIYRGFDYGYARPFAVNWYAADEEGCVYVIDELYGMRPNQPNTGVEMDPAQIAAEIRRKEDGNPNLRGRKITGIADPAIFARSTGESIADLMARHPNNVMWSPGDNARLAGKMQVHYRLAFDAEGAARLYAFTTCRNFIRTIPTLVYDQRHVEDVDTECEDHIYDELRYVLMENPVSPRKTVEPGAPQDDPLNLYADAHRADKYRFYRI